MIEGWFGTEYRHMLSIARETEGSIELIAAGPWTVAQADQIDVQISEVIARVRGRAHASLQMAGVTQFDTYGAWLLERLCRASRKHGLELDIKGLPDRFADLAAALNHAPDIVAGADRRSRIDEWLSITKRRFSEGVADLNLLLSLLGAVGHALATTIARPATFRLTSLVHQLDRVAWQAVPIILLITFLIGGIIAQQGFFHFRKFGADDYVVDMVGILVLRELGVLLVAIMVAGRSGSAYTAELGSMKMREEIDALRTMGLDPTAVLMLPRILALMLALPALAFIGALSALYGGGLVAWLYGDMAPAIYIERLRDAVSMTHFKVGLIKAPFMALVIGLVACAEGLKVKGSAQSLGLQTTISVVKSIFLVIVLDGLFAMYFSAIGM